MGIKPISLFLCCVLATGRLLGQYPVQVMPQLTPPYSLQLNDYYNSTVPKLAVLLTDRDLTRPSLNVRLKMTISGQSATISTIDNVFYPPITLDAGVPVRVTGSELAPYFNPENLNFQGITRAQYMSQGQLPEGYYQFCFEAIETTTGRVVSSNSCAMAWLDLSDPPLLNLPSTASNVVFQDPLNIVFSWTPRNSGNPNSAFSTTYDFQLVEITDTMVDPTGAFTMLPPLYTATTSATTFLYGPGQPTLLTGHRYAWRVQAQAMSNGQQLSLFNNNGYSNVNWFTLEDNCQPPLSSTAVIQNGGVHISWVPQSAMLGYEVDYRLQGADTAAWFTEMATADSATIYDVSPGQTYEYRIGGACSVAGGTTYGNVQAFTVPASDTIGNPNCGILPNINTANQTPLPALNVNDVFMAGDFPVKVLQTSGANGQFTGTGYVTVPFLGQAMVKVGWSGIGINTDHKLISGVVMTAFDSTAKQVANVDTVIQTLSSLVSVIDSFVNNYTGTPKDQQQATIYQQMLDSLTGAVINNPNVPDSVKQPLIAAQNMGDPALKNYATATPCPDSTSSQPAASSNTNGPSASFTYDPDYSCNKAAVQTYATAAATATQTVSDLATKQEAIVFCLSADNVPNLKGSVFFDPDGHPVDIGSAIPYAFYSSVEIDLSLPGRLYGYMRNGVLYGAYFYSESGDFAGYAPLVGPGQKIPAWDENKRGDKSVAQLVVNDPNCMISVTVNHQVQASFSQTNCTGCTAWPQANQDPVTPVGSPYAPHLGDLITQGIKIAAVLVDSLVTDKQFNTTLESVRSSILSKITGTNLSDFVVTEKAAGNYFIGLRDMAQVSADAFNSTKVNIIENDNLDNFRKIRIVDRRISTALGNQLAVITKGAEAAAFVASMSVFPEVGKGPKGPRINSLLQQRIVDITLAKLITREAVDGMTNVYKATADEVAEATAVIRNYRTSIGEPEGGNYGYLEGTAGSETCTGSMVRSSAPEDSDPAIFTALKVNSKQEIDGTGAWLRVTDSEYKMLSDLAKKLGANKGEVYPNVTGELKIVSENKYCPSCSGVISQFNKMFPNLKLILVDGAK